MATVINSATGTVQLANGTATFSYTLTQPAPTTANVVKVSVGAPMNLSKEVGIGVVSTVVPERYTITSLLITGTATFTIRSDKPGSTTTVAYRTAQQSGNNTHDSVTGSVKLINGVASVVITPQYRYPGVGVRVNMYIEGSTPGFVLFDALPVRENASYDIERGYAFYAVPAKDQTVQPGANLSFRVGNPDYKNKAVEYHMYWKLSGPTGNRINSGNLYARGLRTDGAGNLTVSLNVPSAAEMSSSPIPSDASLYLTHDVYGTEPLSPPYRGELQNKVFWTTDKRVSYRGTDGLSSRGQYSYIHYKGQNGLYN